jgi:hypothetical protein
MNTEKKKNRPPKSFETSRRKKQNLKIGGIVHGIKLNTGSKLQKNR